MGSTIPKHVGLSFIKNAAELAKGTKAVITESYSMVSITVPAFRFPTLFPLMANFNL